MTEALSVLSCSCRWKKKADFRGLVSGKHSIQKRYSANLQQLLTRDLVVLIVVWRCRTKGGGEKCVSGRRERAEAVKSQLKTEGGCCRWKKKTKKHTHTVSNAGGEMDWLAIPQDGRLSVVTFPLLCAFRGLLDIEGFMLLSSVVGNVQCNMSNNHSGQREGFSWIPRVGKLWCVGGGGHGSSVKVLCCTAFTLYGWNRGDELKRSDRGVFFWGCPDTAADISSRAVVLKVIFTIFTWGQTENCPVKCKTTWMMHKMGLLCPVTAFKDLWSLNNIIINASSSSLCWLLLLLINTFIKLTACVALLLFEFSWLTFVSQKLKCFLLGDLTNTVCFCQ